MKKNSIKVSEVGFTVLVQPKIVGNILYYGVGETTDQKALHHLNDLVQKLNRLPKTKHVQNLLESIAEFGYAGGIVVLIYDGVAYLVDGNNRAQALFSLGGLVRFNFAYVDTFDQLMDTTIRLNNTGLRWGSETFSNSFAARNMPAYQLIDKYRNTPLQTSIIAALVGNLSVATAKKMFKLGKINVGTSDVPFIQKRIDLVIKFLSIYNTYNWGSRVSEGVLLFVKNIGWIEFERVYQDVANAALKFKGNNQIGIITNTSQYQFENLFNHVYEQLKKAI